MILSQNKIEFPFQSFCTKHYPGNCLNNFLSSFLGCLLGLLKEVINFWMWKIRNLELYLSVMLQVLPLIAHSKFPSMRLVSFSAVQIVFITIFCLLGINQWNLTQRARSESLLTFLGQEKVKPYRLNLVISLFLRSTFFKICW